MLSLIIPHGEDAWGLVWGAGEGKEGEWGGKAIERVDGKKVKKEIDERDCLRLSNGPEAGFSNRLP